MQAVETNSAQNEINVLQGTTQSQLNPGYQEQSSGPPGQGPTEYPTNSDSQNQHGIPSSVQQQSVPAPLPQKQQQEVSPQQSQQPQMVNPTAPPPSAQQPQQSPMFNPAPPPPSTQHSGPPISGPSSTIQQQQTSTAIQDQRQVRCGACEVCSQINKFYLIKYHFYVVCNK